MERELVAFDTSLGSVEIVKLISLMLLKGESDGVGTKDKAGVVRMLVGLLLCLELDEELV